MLETQPTMGAGFCCLTDWPVHCLRIAIAERILCCSSSQLLLSVSRLSKTREASILLLNLAYDQDGQRTVCHLTKINDRMYKLTRIGSLRAMFSLLKLDLTRSVSSSTRKQSRITRLY